MKSLNFTMLLLAISFCLSAQTEEKNSLWMEYLEEMSESEIDSQIIENLHEELSYLSEHPFDLNTVTRKDLERLPFLSELQIENILYYIYKYAPLTTLYELKNVEDLDYQSIQFLLPFVYIGKEKTQDSVDLKRMVKYGKSEMLIRFDDCLQQKSGYRKGTEEEREKHPSHFYQGEEYYLSLKYGFQYKKHIQFGLVGEKDSGEAFCNTNHKGFDFYSAHLVIKNFGVLEGLYLGDYRLSFGQGLVMNTDFTMGKTSNIVIGKNNSGIKRHFSSNENDFFRGGAVALRFNPVVLNLFFSHRDLDATADSNTIYTFKTDGYNRTLNDLKKRRQADVNLLGANMQWKSEWIHLGLTATGYNFGNKELNPDPKAYNFYYLRGNENYNIGIDYTFQRKRCMFQGETAISENGGTATINNFLLNPASFVNFVLSYRNYNIDYTALYSRVLSEGSMAQNEIGYYLGIKLFFLKHWELDNYWDYFQFPWLKYGIDAPSYGKDVLLQLNYTASRSWNMNVRYKFKEKEKNSSGKIASILPYDLHRWKYQLTGQIANSFQLKTQLDYNIYFNILQKKTTGWSASQAIGYKLQNKRLQIDGSFAYFNAIDWDNHISSYEKNVLYVFNMPTFYGEGLRYFVLTKWELANPVTVYLKVSSTHYFDRNTISSGLEEISGREKSDVSFLLKWKF